MPIKPINFSVRFDDNNQEISLAGSFRPKKAEEMDFMREVFSQSAAKIQGTLYVNLRRVTSLNNNAFKSLVQAITDCCRDHPELKISIIISSVVGWATRRFKVFKNLSPRIEVDLYDKEFYPGQGFLEDGGFIPILRTQTKMTWRHERHILPRHGMSEGMHVADICCGIGDFAALIYKEFKPSRIVALDHSQSSLAYARKVAGDFGIKDVQYIYGDASALLLEDNEFDFVTCRHSLQVFNKPEQILKELFRICKPGGRVYITNEKNSHCLGEPHSESIQWTYTEVARLWDSFKMDIELGPKSRRFMAEAGFEKIQLESFMVTNLDGDPQDFADVVQAWEDVYAGGMSVKRGDDAEFNARFRKGFQDHIRAALHPKGYAGWPIWVASGQKPA